MKSGLNGRTSSTTDSRQVKIVVVLPYLISPEKIHQVSKTVKTGMYKLFIKQVLSGTFLPETQEKFLIFSRNRPLELTLRLGLKVSSVAERQLRNFNLNMVAHHKEHGVIKLLEWT